MESIVESIFTNCLVVILVTICGFICFCVFLFCMSLLDKFFDFY